MEQVKAEPVAWMRELVAEGLWHRKRKALDLPAEYRPSSRTDFMDEAAAIISNATPQPAAVDGLVEALRPFALVAEHDIGEDESDFDLFKSLSYNHAPRITVGDIRRAHQALTKIKQS